MDKEAKKTKQEETAPPRKKRGILGGLITLLAVIALALAVVAMTTMRDNEQLAALRRWMVYGGSSSTANLYAYASHPDNRYGQMGEELLVVSPNAIQLMKSDGTSLYDLSVSLENPQLSVGKKQAAVCEVGGNVLYVLDSVGVARTLQADTGLCFYSARMNGRDYLTVTEQKNGYKAAVTVYDSEGEELFRFDSYDHYISDALVTEDGKSLLTVALAPLDGVFSSMLRCYDITSGELTGEWSVRDGLILDYCVTGERMVALCDTRLVVTDLTGQCLLDRGFDNLYLHEYAISGADFCALLLGRYQSGNICQLTTYDLDGAEIATLEVTEEVLDISAAGSGLAVLYSDSVVIYDRALTELARLEDMDYAGQVRMREDGTALVIGAASAWYFLP